MRQRNRNRIESIIDSEGILTITLWIFNESKWNKRIEMVVLLDLCVYFSFSIIILLAISRYLYGDGSNRLSNTQLDNVLYTHCMLHTKWLDSIEKNITFLRAISVDNNDYDDDDNDDDDNENDGVSRLKIKVITQETW